MSSSRGSVNDAADDAEAVVGSEMLVVEKVASRKSDKVQLPEPPDGGLDAWLKVFGGFLMYSNIWWVKGDGWWLAC